MDYTKFQEYVLRCEHETIYEDSEGREVLVICLLDAFAMTRRLINAEREACAKVCESFDLPLIAEAIRERAHNDLD